MFFRAVPRVVVEPIFGIQRRVVLHERVAEDFGKNARRADRIHVRVAFYNALLRKRKIERHIAVGQHVIGRKMQPLDRLDRKSVV